MRSDLVYSAGRSIENRFVLATVISQIIRKLHVDSTRTEDTANQAFDDISKGRYIPVKFPELKPQPLIETLIISPAA